MLNSINKRGSSPKEEATRLIVFVTLLYFLPIDGGDFCGCISRVLRCKDNMFLYNSQKLCVLFREHRKNVSYLIRKCRLFILIR